MGSGPGSDESSGDARGRAAERKARPVRACSLAEERSRTAVLLGEEDGARRQGLSCIAGLDEVGRGCLAGPVFAGAVVLGPGTPILGLDDSKVLPAEVREELSERIQRRAAACSVGAATAAEIDAIGIVPATQLAMRRALDGLPVVPDLLLLDAILLPGHRGPQKSFIRGDARVASIAAAAIVAKVARDRHMDTLDTRYPHYGFGSHKGYGTTEHREALRRHGPSPEHRLTFDQVLPSGPRKES